MHLKGLKRIWARTRQNQQSGTVKPVLVATSIKQSTCTKQAHIQFPKQANRLKRTCIKQAPVLKVGSCSFERI